MKALCDRCYGSACVGAGVTYGELEVYATRPLWPRCEACGAEPTRWLVRDAVAEYVMPQSESCNPHPDAPHGFDRNASHSAGRYVCECEGWTPETSRVHLSETSTGGE